MAITLLKVSPEALRRVSYVDPENEQVVDIPRLRARRHCPQASRIRSQLYQILSLSLFEKPVLQAL
jgi:hypothetical protein